MIGIVEWISIIALSDRGQQYRTTIKTRDIQYLESPKPGYSCNLHIVGKREPVNVLASCADYFNLMFPGQKKDLINVMKDIPK